MLAPTDKQDYDCNCRERVDCLVNVTGEFESVNHRFETRRPHTPR